MDIDTILIFLKNNWGMILYLAGSVIGACMTLAVDYAVRKPGDNRGDMPAAISIALLFSWVWIFAMAIGRMMYINSKEETRVNKENEQANK